MQVSISVEPYLGLDISILTQYLDKIVRLKETQVPDLSVHFDYFRPNEAVLNLLKSYADKIDIYVHLMQPMALGAHSFKAVSLGITEQPAYGDERQGVVIDLGGDISGYEDLLRATKYVTIMTVKCGKSGQTFNESALALVPKIRALNPQAIITVDGGVNETNISLLKKAGIDIVVVGNYARKAYETGTLAISVNRLLRD